MASQQTTMTATTTLSHHQQHPTKKQKKNPLLHLVAGGVAGFVESSVCHPLDTIKTRMQLLQKASASEESHTASVLRRLTFYPTLVGGGKAMARGSPPVAPLPPSGSLAAAVSTRTAGPFSVLELLWGRSSSVPPKSWTQRFLGLYQGLSAVYMGIIPKMAIRFVSFEQYRDVIHRARYGPSASNTGSSSPTVNFLAGLATGITEAVLVVTPADVCKIRLQGQLQHQCKYTNVWQTAATIVREEGLPALYKGVVPTMLRQGCNQAVNFTAYQFLKHQVLQHEGVYKGRSDVTQLQHWQSLLIGGISGGLGPLVNNPIDVVKTRMQKQVIEDGKEPKYKGLMQATHLIAKEEGMSALWKGITPRLMRIMPGQAITFMTYEAVKTQLEGFQVFA